MNCLYFGRCLEILFLNHIFLLFSKGAIVIPLEQRDKRNLEVVFSDLKCSYITSAAFNEFKSNSISVKM